MANLIKWEIKEEGTITQRFINLDAIAEISAHRGDKKNCIVMRFITGHTTTDEFQGDSRQENVDYIVGLINDKASND